MDTQGVTRINNSLYPINNGSIVEKIESDGHGDINHAILANEQSMKRCSNVSIPPSHKGQFGVSTRNLFQYSLCWK